MRSFPLPNPTMAQHLLHELTRLPSSVGPHSADRPLVLYGAGNLGRMATDLLQRLQLPVQYVIDRSPPPDGILLGHIPVMHPEQAPIKHHDSHMVAVCVVTFPYTPIQESLRAMGWRTVHHFYDISEAYVDQIPMANGWFTGQLNFEDIEQLTWVLPRWADDHSRAAHLQWLAWRAHRLEWAFPGAPVMLENRFFIKPMLDALTQREFFLDAGAYQGDVIEKFLSKTAGAHEGIVAIEPDHENAARLRSNLTKLDSLERQSRIRVLECALGATRGIRPFYHGLDVASCLAPQASGHVLVQTLDDLNLPATFIKLHLEGAELEALQGAIVTLRLRRPLLAVTLYHSRDGLWKIPAFLMESLEGYKFMLRLHAWCGTGCVMYAIPEERYISDYCIKG